MSEVFTVKVHQLYDCFVIGKHLALGGVLSYLRVQALDGIGGIDNFSQLYGLLKKRPKQRPVVFQEATEVG